MKNEDTITSIERGIECFKYENFEPLKQTHMEHDMLKEKLVDIFVKTIKKCIKLINTDPFQIKAHSTRQKSNQRVLSPTADDVSNKHSSTNKSHSNAVKYEIGNVIVNMSDTRIQTPTSFDWAPCLPVNMEGFPKILQKSKEWYFWVCYIPLTHPFPLAACSRM